MFMVGGRWSVVGYQEPAWSPPPITDHRPRTWAQKTADVRLVRGTRRWETGSGQAEPPRAAAGDGAAALGALVWIIRYRLRPAGSGHRRRPVPGLSRSVRTPETVSRWRDGEGSRARGTGGGQ